MIPTWAAVAMFVLGGWVVALLIAGGILAGTGKYDLIMKWIDDTLRRQGK